MISPFYIDTKGKLNDVDLAKRAMLRRAERRERIVRLARLMMKYGEEGKDYYV